MTRGVKAIRLTKQNWGPDALRDPETKKMCCLGIFGEACGVDLTKMDNLGMPNEVEAVAQKSFPKWLFEDRAPSKDAALLAGANDHYFSHADAGAREIDKRIIRKTFAKHGVRVTFARGL